MGDDDQVQQQRPENPCLLCGGSGQKSQEHAMPAWFLRLRKDHGQPVPSPPPKLRICIECNERSNTRFEVPARPLIEALSDGEPMHLTPKECAIVAAWTIKSQAMTALVRANNEKAVDIPDREEVRDDFLSPLLYLLHTGLMPPHVRMFASRLVPGAPAEPGAMRILLLREPGSPEVRNVAFMTVGHFWSMIVDAHELAGHPSQAFVDSLLETDQHLLVWPPPPGGANFPPPVPLSSLEAQFVEGTWNMGKAPLGSVDPARMTLSGHIGQLWQTVLETGRMPSKEALSELTARLRAAHE